MTGTATAFAAAAGVTVRPGRVGVLIPAFNCESTIGPVVARAREIIPDVLVVDDGSADGTARVAAEAGAIVLRHRPNQGKGAALTTGLRYFAEHGMERAVTMDGDGQHLASQLPLLLRESDQAPADLVIGARRLDGVPTTAVRLFGNRFADRWVEIASGRAIPDTQSGFRVYPVAATLSLGLRARRFAFETEVLIRGARAGIGIRSVPTEVYYPPPGERVSHYRPFLDTVRIIGVVVGLILRIW